MPNDTTRSGNQEDKASDLIMKVLANRVMKASRRGVELEGHTTETMMQEYLSHKEICQHLLIAQQVSGNTS